MSWSKNWCNKKTFHNLIHSDDSEEKLVSNLIIMFATQRKLNWIFVPPNVFDQKREKNS